jgi:hypothetical protein
MVPMSPMDIAPLSGLVVMPPMMGLLPVGDRGAPLGGTLPTWLLRPVVDLGVPPPVLGGLGLVPALPLLGGLLTGLAWLFGMATSILLACPPNTLEKLSMGGVVAFTVGRSSFASSGGGWPIHALVAHVFITLDITTCFHRVAIVLTGCSPCWWRGMHRQCSGPGRYTCLARLRRPS